MTNYEATVRQSIPGRDIRRTLNDAALARTLKRNTNDLRAAGIRPDAYEAPLCQLCRTTGDVKAVAVALGVIEEGK
jgi:hypothetical protein